MRAMRRMWAKIMKNRFGATDPKALMPRFGMSTGGSILTAQQPLNNSVRTTLTMLAVALGGAQTATLMCYDEAHEIPSEEAQRVAIRTQQIIAYESGVTNTIDPLAGSYYAEARTDEVQHEAEEIIAKIDDMGGAVAAIENGYMQQGTARSASEYQRQVESGKRIIVGVNAFTDDSELEVLTSRLVPYPYSAEKRAQAEKTQVANLGEMKRNRDNRAVTESLKQLKGAAKDEEVNLIPPILEAVKTYATLGEISDTLREVFGEYKER